jgi:cyclase
MLATRIIPTILSSQLKLVKGRGYASDRVVGHALQAGRIHSARGVDELMILDVSATPTNREPDYRMVEELTETCFTPVTIGGGIRTKEQVRKLLRAGADKVAICTAALDNPLIIREITDEFGSQALVVSIDVKDNMVWSNCGKTCRGIDPVRWARRVVNHGAGEIMLSSIDRDGTMVGYDIGLISDVANEVLVPVIASGGCGSYDDMVSAIRAGASAVASGAMFLFTDNTPQEAAHHLQSQGIEARCA